MTNIPIILEGRKSNIVKNNTKTRKNSCLRNAINRGNINNKKLNGTETIARKYAGIAIKYTKNNNITTAGTKKNKRPVNNIPIIVNLIFKSSSITFI